MQSHLTHLVFSTIVVFLVLLAVLFLTLIYLIVLQNVLIPQGQRQ